jgi:hypothetical protein
MGKLVLSFFILDGTLLADRHVLSFQLKHAKQIQLSVECAKLREDEILQDKTKQLQTAGRTAFRDKQMQLRMTSESLDESVEILSKELDQVVELEESFDSTVVPNSGENKDDQQAADMVEVPSRNVLLVNNEDFETMLTKSELNPVEHCVANENPDSCLSEVCANKVSEMLVESCVTELAGSAKTAESEDVNSLLKSGNIDSAPGIRDSDVAYADAVCSQCDVTRADTINDTPVDSELTAMHNVKTDNNQETELVAHSVKVSNTAVIESESEDTAVQNNLMDAVKRQSPTDDSSDAYTDVLDEDTDRLSEILEKEDQPGPSVYVELQNDLSAFTDSSSANIKLTTVDVVESETDRKQSQNTAEENELGW